MIVQKMKAKRTGQRFDKKDARLAMCGLCADRNPKRMPEQQFGQF